jgi:hypothetical protein
LQEPWGSAGAVAEKNGTPVLVLKKFIENSGIPGKEHESSNGSEIK